MFLVCKRILSLIFPMFLLLLFTRTCRVIVLHFVIYN
ncbi:hypothetical protein T08_11711 [Trichinella sp. T8]|nr:hypothetical protein T08_11711 [Trichinella sp. T8]